MLIPRKLQTIFIENNKSPFSQKNKRFHKIFYQVMAEMVKSNQKKNRYRGTELKTHRGFLALD